MTAALVISLSQVPTASGAASASSPALSAHSRAQDLMAVRVLAPEKCLSARQAVAYYRAHTWKRQSARGGALSDRTPIVRRKSCHWARYAARVWIARAKAAGRVLAHWRHEWDWSSWLPEKWYRIARCETGVRWDWNSGAYQGAFGFAVSSWDAFRLPGYPSEAYLATPRQQWEVGLAIWRAYGFSGWGCRNA